MKITQAELERIAINYINSDCTIGSIADSYGISKTTLVRYFSGTGRIKLSPELQASLDQTKHDRWLAGKSTNGNLGKKKYSDEAIIAAATKMVEENLTLRDLALDTDASLGTLYARFNEKVLGKELYEKVTGLYEQNLEVRTVPKKNRANVGGNNSDELGTMTGDAINNLPQSGKLKK